MYARARRCRLIYSYLSIRLTCMQMNELFSTYFTPLWCYINCLDITHRPKREHTFMTLPAIASLHNFQLVPMPFLEVVTSLGSNLGRKRSCFFWCSFGSFSEGVDGHQRANEFASKVLQGWVGESDDIVRTDLQRRRVFDDARLDESEADGIADEACRCAWPIQVGALVRVYQTSGHGLREGKALWRQSVNDCMDRVCFGHHFRRTVYPTTHNINRNINLLYSTIYTALPTTSGGDLAPNLGGRKTFFAAQDFSMTFFSGKISISGWKFLMTFF